MLMYKGIDLFVTTSDKSLSSSLGKTFRENRAHNSEGFHWGRVSYFCQGFLTKRSCRQAVPNIVISPLGDYCE